MTYFQCDPHNWKSQRLSFLNTQTVIPFFIINQSGEKIKYKSIPSIKGIQHHSKTVATRELVIYYIGLHKLLTKEHMYKMAQKKIFFLRHKTLHGRPAENLLFLLFVFSLYTILNLE